MPPRSMASLSRQIVRRPCSRRFPPAETRPKRSARGGPSNAGARRRPGRDRPELCRKWDFVAFATPARPSRRPRRGGKIPRKRLKTNHRVGKWRRPWRRDGADRPRRRRDRRSPRRATARPRRAAPPARAKARQRRAGRSRAERGGSALRPPRPCPRPGRERRGG